MAGTGTRSSRVVRRVVTGHSDDGTAKVIIDAAATNTKFSPTGAVSTLMWSTDECPADIALGENAEDFGARILGTPPPPHGTRFTVIDLPPHSTGGMHRTETIDYVIVLSGTVDMEFDESAVTLEAGDILIQRGTNHAWINRSDAVVRIAVVLIDAKPLGIGHAVARQESAR
jgi:quercetin dioxygenase-like cupin family protein